MTLTTILPGLILGPVLGPKYSSSVGMVVQMMQGKIPRLPRFGFSIIDVRDLADLHIKAMEQPDAAGQRFVGTSDFLWMSDMAGLLHEHFGSQAAKVSTKILPDFVIQIGALINSDLRFFAPSLGKEQVFSSAKADRMLDWHPRPASESLIDCTQSLIRSGLV
jgi:dihydroflavonol-4-reductase